jgi:penicillin-binding protein 2
LPGNIKFCEADKGYIGWVNVKEALARSSNIFFCKTMIDLRKAVGYKYYYDIAKSYGIGNETGIDLIGEASGILPSEDYKKTITTEPWYVGDECNTVIGQGYVTVTPLQMTVAISAIMNGGEVLKPQILKKIVDQNGVIVLDTEKQVTRNLNISQKTLDIIKKGLRMGVTAGTAGPLNFVPGNSVGKTGSSDASEIILGKVYSGAHSWVMGCFDYQGENYCFTVMQQLGGRGYKTVPVMKKFINCVYNNFQNNCDAIL